MGFGDLFKSQAERQKELAKRRRVAFRKAEMALDATKRSVVKLRKDREKSWAEAAEYLKDGRKAAARDCLRRCRALELLMARLERKQQNIGLTLTRLKEAENDQQLARELAGLLALTSVDPDVVGDTLDGIMEKLDEQVASDREWERAYERGMNEMDEMLPEEEGYALSLKEMEKQLEDEVAAELESQRSLKATEEGETEPSVQRKIGEGYRRLKDLMEGDK